MRKNTEANEKVDKEIATNNKNKNKTEILQLKIQ